MARPDDPIVKERRRIFKYHKSWDVVLCTPWHELEGVTQMHIRFFEQILDGIETLGKTCFLQHKHYANIRDIEDFKIKQAIVGQIVVPTSDLILNYCWSMGTPLSYSAINVSAVGNFVPEICFVEEENRDEVEPGVLELIVFKNHADCVEKLKQAVKRFYDRG